jgi:RNA-directed DNA polymerase
LARLQKKLADLLSSCIHELSVHQKNNLSSAHGFLRSKSIVTNAAIHRKQKWVCNLDLEDFFGSINFGRVRGFFINDKRFNLSAETATFIAQIACHENKLPQGSPTSPVISNLVGSILDAKMRRLAKMAGCKYSRYADDLTFSSSRKAFSSHILFQTSGPFVDFEPSEKLRQILKEADFKLNEKKFRLVTHTSRMTVTGITVNSKLSANREYKKTVRSIIQRLFINGDLIFDGIAAPRDQFALNKIEGMLNFIDYVGSANTDRQDSRPASMTSFQKLHRDFHLYRYLYAPEKPTILCEGKTDYVYLGCALSAIGQDFSELKPKDGDKTKPLKFLHYGKKRSKLFGLNGGTGDIKNLLEIYLEVQTKFSFIPNRSPLIFVMDNDDGLRPVKSWLKDKLGIELSITKQFTKLFSNCYVVLTPIDAVRRTTCMEDFFDQALLERKIGVKTFQRDSRTFDETKHYGKEIFATKVVSADQRNISFEGFRPIFQRIDEVIREHRG